jgi:hypothetical protein
MTGKYPPPIVTIKRYSASRICDVVVVVRGQEMVVRCPSYSQALKWARLECKSYKIPEPETDLSDDEEADDVPLFCVKIDIDLLLGAKHGKKGRSLFVWLGRNEIAAVPVLMSAELWDHRHGVGSHHRVADFVATSDLHTAR